MKIQLLRPWGMAVKGEILTDVNDPVAEQLIRRKVAKKVIKKKRKKND